MVLRPQARAPWQPAATVDAHQVGVWYQELGAVGLLVGSPISLGRFASVGEISIPYNPATNSRSVRVYLMPYGPDGTAGYSSLRDAQQFTVFVTRDGAIVLASDEHVPTVTLAPTVAKADGADEWVVLIPDPDAHGATLTGCEIKVEKADDADVFSVWPFHAGPQHRIRQEPYPSVISYRLRNQSSEDAGNGRGWSDWSPAAAAAEVGAAAPPTPVATALQTFIYDTNDSRAAVVSEVISAE